MVAVLLVIALSGCPPDGDRVATAPTYELELERIEIEVFEDGFTQVGLLAKRTRDQQLLVVLSEFVLPLEVMGRPLQVLDGKTLATRLFENKQPVDHIPAQALFLVYDVVALTDGDKPPDEWQLVKTTIKYHIIEEAGQHSIKPLDSTTTVEKPKFRIGDSPNILFAAKRQ